MPWAKDKDRIKANYKKLVEYKKKIRCDHCGVRDHRIIDFHHTRDKDGEVSTLIYQGMEKSMDGKELKKKVR